jgi:WS/DGAT/MGAT family acyltransferase
MPAKHKEFLSRADAAWLRMEDPTNLMMVTGMLIFDEPITMAQLKTAVEERLLSFARFRQRVVMPTAPGEAPHWEEDQHFLLRAHLHRIALPAPGNQHELQALVSDLMSTPLDFTKPLWQMHLIENYGRGCAIVLRIHHSIGDGVALTHVLDMFADHQPVEEPLSRRAAPAHPLFTLVQNATSVVSSALQTTEAAINEVRLLIDHPGHALDRVNQGATAVGAVSKLLLMESDPPTLFKGPLTVAKQAAWSCPILLQDVKAIGRVTKTTVNDVVLAAVAGALRRYLQERNQPVDGIDIRAVVPVNLRAIEKNPEMGNRFGVVFLGLPIGIDDPLARLDEVQERMEQIKQSPEAMVAFGILTVVGMAPDAVEQFTVNMFGAKATAVMTNVRGPSAPLRLAAHPIKQVMFWVPQSGRLGLGVSIMSYAGQVFLGIATDAGLVPDPEAIIANFHIEFEQLGRLVRLHDHTQLHEPAHYREVMGNEG